MLFEREPLFLAYYVMDGLLFKKLTLSLLVSCSSQRVINVYKHGWRKGSHACIRMAGQCRRGCFCGSGNRGAHPAAECVPGRGWVVGRACSCRCARLSCSLEKAAARILLGKKRLAFDQSCVLLVCVWRS